jgi:virginiamycin B lyase
VRADTSIVRRRSGPPSVAAAIAISAATLFALAGTPASASTPTWFDLPVADSFPHGIAAGPDGATWVTTRFADRIVRIRPDGASSTFQLGAGADPHSIVLGPDGAMWFTEHNAGRIARLTLGGELSEFPLRERSLPGGIAAGSDGAVWFTQRGVSAIGRVTTDGTVTEWQTPSDRAAPLGIAAGPDGALWFTESNLDAIGRIATDGAISRFPLPVGSQPQWIVAGPDGALWFTQRGTNRIGRLTVDGGLTHHDVPTPAAGLNAIAVGPDGAIWFTESGADAIGRITMDGRVDEFPLGEGASPTGIAAGPDGHVWFGAAGTNRVGRLPADMEEDATPPVVTIVSPPDGAVLLAGQEVPADYRCEDEPGGSGVAACVGPVPVGGPVDVELGSHTFSVTATDVAGNTASATHGYVVVADVRGPIANHATLGAGRTIPISLELEPGLAGNPFADGYPRVVRTDCATGERSGEAAAAEADASVSAAGRVHVLWRTDAAWAGSCRSLVLRFAWDGWSDAEAVFTIRLV